MSCEYEIVNSAVVKLFYQKAIFLCAFKQYCMRWILFTCCSFQLQMVSIDCNAESWFQHFITGSHSRPLLFCIRMSSWFPKPTPNFMSLLTMGPHIQLYVDPTTCVFEISKILRYEWNGNSLYFKLITHIVYNILIVKMKQIVTCKVKKDCLW